MPVIVIDVMEHIFNSCSAGVLLRFSRTNKYYNHYLNTYMKAHWSIRKHLEPIFPGLLYDEFRALQAKSGLVIFGSSVLNFFARTIDPDALTDMMVTLPASGEVINWFESRGYRRVVDKRAEEDEGGDEDSDSFESDSDDERRGRTPDIVRYSDGTKTVHIWIAHHCTLDYVVGSNLTATMNFITANDAVSLYPHSTLDTKVAVRIRNHDNALSDAFVLKYRSLGWNVLDYIMGCDRATPRSDFYADYDITGIRFVGDGKCWTLPCVPDSPIPEMGLTHFMNSWCLEFTPEGTYTRFHVLQSPELRDRYLVAQNTDLQQYIRRVINDRRDSLVQYKLHSFFGA
ncbi:hypothetical protein BDN72DRAFT_904625 [Pluteus cervinus]|uniref:Uncharacterized protein n=1 Tax=Pluteus cervinus TaxID=181527 RepID=A0ACD3A618_9AGAR|nr:hypothetical protein BDN72DRAFT_904625 [Pluteus cervinus]